MSSAAATRLLDRGIWRAPYLVDDVPVLIAVDRFGVVRKHVKLRAGVEELRAAAWLAELLDRVDPPRQLRLVSTPPPRLELDPRTPQGKRRYWAQLARAAARRLPPI